METADAADSAIVDVAQLLLCGTQSFERPNGAGWRRNRHFIGSVGVETAAMIRGRHADS